MDNTNNSEFIELPITETDVSLVSSNLIEIYLFNKEIDFVNKKFVFYKGGFYSFAYLESNELKLGKNFYFTIGEVLEVCNVNLTKELIEALNKQLRENYIKKSINKFYKDIRFNNYLVNEQIFEILNILLDLTYLYKADGSYLMGKFLVDRNSQFVGIDNRPGFNHKITYFKSYDYFTSNEEILL